MMHCKCGHTWAGNGMHGKRPTVCPIGLTFTARGAMVTGTLPCSPENPIWASNPLAAMRLPTNSAFDAFSAILFILDAILGPYPWPSTLSIRTNSTFWAFLAVLRAGGSIITDPCPWPPIFLLWGDTLTNPIALVGSSIPSMVNPAVLCTGGP